MAKTISLHLTMTWTDWHELNTLQVKYSDLSVMMIDERPCTLENEFWVSKTFLFHSNMNVDTYC